MRAHAEYRLRLARGFLEEAEQDFAAGRWRACMAHAQLSVEHALKGVIALFTVPPKTHNPARTLALLLEAGQIPTAWRDVVPRLIREGKRIGPQIHIQTDYGDEAHGLTPWELFSEEDAREALAIARRVVEEAARLIQEQGGTDEA
nr:HEPN domain-containing protein [Ardenticatena sp.]